MCRTRDQNIFDENNFSSLRVFEIKIPESILLKCCTGNLQSGIIIFEECKIRDGPLVMSKTNLV